MDDTVAAVITAEPPDAAPSTPPRAVAALPAQAPEPANDFETYFRSV